MGAEIEEIRINTARAICVVEIIAMVCASVGALLAGDSWLLFGTVPVAAIAVWMFARAAAPVPR